MCECTIDQYSMTTLPLCTHLQHLYDGSRVRDTSTNYIHLTGICDQRTRSLVHAHVHVQSYDSSNMAQVAAPPTLPNKPPNLKVGDELNRGAWGAVYNGELEGRPVAVKRIHELLHQGRSEEERRKLFEDLREECKKLQTLSHPHVVSK